MFGSYIVIVLFLGFGMEIVGVVVISDFILIVNIVLNELSGLICG